MITVDPAWELTELRSLRGATLEWLSAEELYVSRANRLYRAEVTNGTPGPLTFYAAVPLKFWKTLAGRVRLGARALRLSFYNLLRLGPNDWFYTFGRDIGRLTDGRAQALPGIVRPMRVLRGGCALATSGNVYFGEYVMNHERDSSIRLYQYDPAAHRTAIVHEFAPAEVRHIHGIYADPVEQGTLWVLSGDLPDECRVMRTRDEFRTLEVVGTGDESWRAVSACFSPEALYYGTDAEFVQNALYRLDRHSGQRIQLNAIGGPVYYSASSGQDHFFGVTAELCPSQADPFAELWHIAAGENPVPQAKCLLRIAKDRWPVKYFQAGHFQFPQGPGLSGALHFSVLGLAGADGRAYQLRRRQ